MEPPEVSARGRPSTAPTQGTYHVLNSSRRDDAESPASKIPLPGWLSQKTSLQQMQTAWNVEPSYSTQPHPAFDPRAPPQAVPVALVDGTIQFTHVAQSSAESLVKEIKGRVHPYSAFSGVMLCMDD